MIRWLRPSGIVYTTFLCYMCWLTYHWRLLDKLTLKSPSCDCQRSFTTPSWVEKLVNNIGWLSSVDNSFHLAFPIIKKRLNQDKIDKRLAQLRRRWLHTVREIETLPCFWFLKTLLCRLPDYHPHNRVKSTATSRQVRNNLARSYLLMCFNGLNWRGKLVPNRIVQRWERVGERVLN